MTWWFALSIVGVIIAGIVIGLLISYIYFKIRKKDFPFSLRPKTQIGQPTERAVRQANHLSSEALKELEENLAIATQASAKAPAAFRTDVWNSRRTQFNILDKELQNELTEVYVDMTLANNTILLIKESGQDSDNLTAGYIKLSDKVAEHLQHLMPTIRNAFTCN